ncbi:hypothetical protein OPV22_011987 [Ensete ventricosum]|uniref:Uncharacterized protein n=1 Tax=Ensete ventricosum TaxID=4639 RepID=A0AAV8R0G7_ENSVE|nr:hypothetical protein OPV22_011987 [Ensete ventricosum]
MGGPRVARFRAKGSVDGQTLFSTVQAIRCPRFPVGNIRRSHQKPREEAAARDLQIAAGAVFAYGMTRIARAGVPSRGPFQRRGPQPA